MARTLGSSDKDGQEPINPNAEARREQQGNVTSATFLEAVREIAKVNAEARAINEKRKGIRKKWKAEGIELGLLDAALKMAEWDRAEVRSHFDTGRRYAEWLGLPVGHQPDMFKNLGDDEIQKREWFALGQVASRLGKPQKAPEECPPEYISDYLRGFADEDEKAWTESEREEAQLEAAATIDPEAPGNVAQIADAMKARPSRKKKTAAGTLDAEAIEPEAAATPQDADAVSGEVLH